MLEAFLMARPPSSSSAGTLDPDPLMDVSYLDSLYSANTLYNLGSVGSLARGSNGALACYNDQLITVGIGAGANGVINWYSVKNGYSLSKTITSTPVFNFGLDGSYYQCGRYLFAGGSRNQGTVFYRVDLVTGEIKALPTLPSGMISASVYIYNGRLWAIGGYAGSFTKNLTKLYSIDALALDAWRAETMNGTLVTGGVPNGQQAYYYNGLFYFYGGAAVGSTQDGSNYTQMLSFDPNTLTPSYTTLATLVTALHHLPIAFLDKYVYSVQSFEGTTPRKVDLTTGQNVSGYTSAGSAMGNAALHSLQAMAGDVTFFMSYNTATVYAFRAG
jgi:hypothetical protein